MTILEQFVAFAEALPADERKEVESLLASIMGAHADEFDLTAEEAAEIDRRREEPSGGNISADKVLARMRKLVG